MKLLETMRQLDVTAMSYFSAQLHKEDLARLERLQQLVSEESEPAEFRRKVMVLGWTQGDLRTFELNPELAEFLDAVRPTEGKTDDAEISRAWNALHKRRMDLLVGCLSRPRLD